MDVSSRLQIYHKSPKNSNYEISASNNKYGKTSNIRDLFVVEHNVFMKFMVMYFCEYAVDELCVP